MTRRPKTFLTAEQKDEIWLKLLTGELASGQAAAKAGVDRSTIMTLRKTALDGAMAALQASQPGRRRDAAEANELAHMASWFLGPVGQGVAARDGGVAARAHSGTIST
jgi:hypothetical protein